MGAGVVVFCAHEVLMLRAHAMQLLKEWVANDLVRWLQCLSLYDAP